MCSSLPNIVEWSVVWAAPLKLVALFGSSWKSCCSCALAEPVCHWNSYQTLVPYRQCIFGTRRKQALKSGYICEKSGELFWTTTEIDITKRLKAMHTSSGTGRNKSQTNSGAWRACKKTSFFICMSTTVMKQTGSITQSNSKSYLYYEDSPSSLVGCWLCCLRWLLLQWYK